MMRHELELGEWTITSDNSGGIGEKPDDVVRAPDKLTAKFAARVALLEQWAASSEPQAVLLHNFSGEEHWSRYVEGIEEVLKEVGLDAVKITGSSETNIETLQSGIAVTIFGKRQRRANAGALTWFVYGVPLVGKDVLEKEEEIADLKKISEARSNGIVERVWPVGSKGIGHEVELMLGEKVNSIPGLKLDASAGPSTCVLIGVREEMLDSVDRHFGKYLFPL